MEDLSLDKLDMVYLSKRKEILEICIVEIYLQKKMYWNLVPLP